MMARARSGLTPGISASLATAGGLATAVIIAAAAGLLAASG
jgi:hypothetical protein